MSSINYPKCGYVENDLCSENHFGHRTRVEIFVLQLIYQLMYKNVIQFLQGDSSSLEISRIVLCNCPKFGISSNLTD